MGLEKAEEPEIKLPTFVGSWRKQGSSSKKSTSASLTTLKPLAVWITTNCRKFFEMEVPVHFTCLLRNLYTGPEETVRTRHGKKDWLKTVKGEHQGCILSLCLFNLMQGAAAAAKSLQSCPTLCDPIDCSHQAPPSLGFSRQEHWSELPFPSPMQESEK